MELSKSYNVTPFEIFKQDKDSVIMLINYFIEKGRYKDAEAIDSNTSEKEQDRQFWNAI